MEYRSITFSRSWNLKTMRAPLSQNLPFSQQTPLYPALHWQLRRTSEPPFRQKRLHALAPIVVTKHFPPHCAGLAIGRLLYWVPRGPHECEQALHADHVSGTQSFFWHLRRRLQAHLGSADTSFITQNTKTTARILKLSHPIKRFAENLNHNVLT